jgi:hypothetical protein
MRGLRACGGGRGWAAQWVLLNDVACFEILRMILAFYCVLTYFGRIFLTYPQYMVLGVIFHTLLELLLIQISK